MLGPYDRISDSFMFRYFPRDFAGFLGKITIHAIFVYGPPGMSWDTAHKCDARELRSSIGLPRLGPWTTLRVVIHCWVTSRFARAIYGARAGKRHIVGPQETEGRH
jgi:hypothetical protein